MPSNRRIRWRVFGRERAGEFLAKGHRQRSFFPHAALFLPRPGPDGAKLARRMCARTDPAALWELVLYADPSMLDKFPADLFFDKELVWHQQHLGRPGQLAYADVLLAGADMWSMSHVSDLVQRIGRRREHKTRIENRFKGWHDMLLNALLAFAVERGVKRLRISTSGLQMRHTDPARDVQPELFERLYDRNVNRLLAARRDGDWWLIDVRENRDRLIQPEVREDPLEPAAAICICHDVEAGLGHEAIDDRLALLANETWRERVKAMLRDEQAARIRATYNVVGRLLADVRPEIEAGGHCVAFHSYDHRVVRAAPTSPERRLVPRGRRRRQAVPPSDGTDQLAACREIDYRLKGYRVPQSYMTSELSDENLLFHNFEWVSSSAASLRLSEPGLRAGIAWIPVHIDDFGLYQGVVDFDSWKALALEAVAANAVAVVSLHDCYADLWLDRYPELLESLQALGELRTVDEVAADLTLAASV